MYCIDCMADLHIVGGIYRRKFKILQCQQCYSWEKEQERAYAQVSR